MIHTVGPVWRGGKSSEEELLASCYLSALELAKKNGIKSIAFPSISTGAYGYPIELAAPVALKTVNSFIEKNPGILEKVLFVLFSDGDYELYFQLIKRR